MTNLTVRGSRVVTPAGTRQASIHIDDGRITAIADFDQIAPSVGIVEAGDSIVMPGLVDTHVHINEPGRTDWEGFQTATKAAAAGGVTTLIEMPLNCIPPTTTVAAFGEKVAAARGQLYVDTGFWAGVVPGNANQLHGLYEAGAFGFKCFLVPSGVNEFQHVTEADLRAAMPILAQLGTPLLVHAEMSGPIESAEAAAKTAAAAKYSTWLASRPRESENQAIEMMIRLAREFGVRTHIVHLSSSDALPLICAAKDECIPITVETCPHYLTFVAEEISDGATQFKCAPPIRERDNNEALWNALHSGLINLVVTDHSPCPPQMKCTDTGDFMRAWGGISSLQLSLPVMWTGLRSRGGKVEELCEWMCRGPARLAGLSQRKGTLAPGLDADIVIWNPDARFMVESDKLFHRHKVTPYSGMTLFGAVEKTIVRGKVVFDRGIITGAPIGNVLLRGRN
jgi:allantoinase